MNSQKAPARSWQSPRLLGILETEAVGKCKIVVFKNYESVIFGTKFHSISESFIFFVHLDRVEQFLFAPFRKIMCSKKRIFLKFCFFWLPFRTKHTRLGPRAWRLQMVLCDARAKSGLWHCIPLALEIWRSVPIFRRLLWHDLKSRQTQVILYSGLIR